MLLDPGEILGSGFTTLVVFLHDNDRSVCDFFSCPQIHWWIIANHCSLRAHPPFSNKPKFDHTWKILKNILRIVQISLFSIHSGNLLQFAIENSPFSSLIDLLKMVIFHSYVSLREGKSWRFHSSPTPSVRHGLMGAKGHKFPGAVAAREMGGRWIADLGSGVFYKNMAI